MQEVILSIDDISLSQPVRQFIEVANLRIEQFRDAQATPIPGFITSDFVMVAKALQWIQQNYAATGNRFCEWGSGFGVNACLASLQGFDAIGIEIESDLCEAAQALADEFGLDAKFANQSFVPDQLEEIIDEAYANGDGDFLQRTFAYEDAKIAWEGDYEDFDVIFAFPWPNDEELLDQMFAQLAGSGTLFLTYHAAGEIRLQRKT